MKRSARAPAATKLVAETAEIGRQRQRLERLLIAAGPIIAAVAVSALGVLPAWISALAAIAAIAWAAVGFAGGRGSELEAARRIDRGLGAKETFLTWSTVPDAGRGPLWPVVAERASEVATGTSPRLFATDFAWRRPLVSFAASLAVVLAIALVVRLAELLPPTAPEELAAIADRLSAPGKDAASRALGAELRALAEKLADPNMSNEEKRKLVAELREKLEKQAQPQQGQQGASGGTAKQQLQQREKNEPSGTSGSQSGAEQGQGNEAGEAAKALGQIEKELAGESEGEQDSKGKGNEKGEQAKGGGLQGPSEGKRAGEKPGEGTGNQPGPKEDGGKSERGEGEGGRESGQQPQGQQGQNESQQNQQGQGSGEGSGGAGKPSLEDTGQKAERYYKVGEGPEAMRVEDGRYVRVLVPEHGGGVGTERVQKPGEVSPEIPFGNAPLPSEGPPGEAEERQPLPLEYRPILRK